MKLHTCGCTIVLAFALGSLSLANAAPVSGQGIWETTLQARDFDGDTETIEGYYDTVLNITWLADANYLQTSGMDFDGANDGRLQWDFADLLTDTFYGIDGWRMPVTGPVNGSSMSYSFSYDGSTDNGYNISAPGSAYPGSLGSEMAYMYYVTLGNKAYCDTSGVCPQADWGLVNTGPFSNIKLDYSYWSDTEYAPDPGNGAWSFNFNLGSQGAYAKEISYFYVWAVHPGDVGAAVASVPIPAAVWLFGSGLAGLITFAYRKKLPF